MRFSTKFLCDLDDSIQKAITGYMRRRETWHKSFALFPHNIGNGECAWLEYVERKRGPRNVWGARAWLYRPVTPE